MNGIMSKLLKSALAVLIVASLVAGIHYTTDFESSGASLFGAVEQAADRTPAVEDREERSTAPLPAGNPLLQFNDAIVEIADRTNPTVVTITTQRTIRQRMRSPFSLFFDDPRFDQEREFRRSGLGSGVIVSSDGTILTNNHVIDGADEIRIRTYDGEELEAEVIGTDPESDLAVLRVDSNTLPSIELGDSDRVRVGELVLAIGSPLDQQLAHTVSMGVVSAKGRAELGLTAYENYIQTDAAINPGNSGGALINMEGKLVGINTAIASRSGGHQGIGFAIPVNMARAVMESILTEGRVVRSYLGIRQGAMVDRVMARALNLDVNYGVVIGEVTPGGPAEEAGLAEGDVLLRKNGEPIRDWHQFRLSIANAPPGTRLEFEVFRDGSRTNRTVTLRERTEELATAVPGERQRDELREDLGFSVDELSENIRRQLGLSTGTEGVVVTEIDQASRAYRQGLRRGDVIFQVQNRPVGDVDQFYSAVVSLRSEGQDVMLLRVNRRGQVAFIAVEL